MTTRSITHEIVATQALLAEVEASGPKAAAALEALAGELGVSLKAGAAAVLADLSALAKAATTRAASTDEAHGVAHASHGAPTAQREADTRDLAHAYRSTRAALVRQYGRAQVASAVAVGDLPKAPEDLVAHVRGALSAIAAAAPKWNVVDATVPVDLGAVTATLRALADRVEVMAKSIASAKGDAHAAIVDRHVAEESLHAVRKGAQHVLVGLLEAAGLADLADRVTVHHHLGHGADPGAVAPAAAGAKPAS